MTGSSEPERVRFAAGGREIDLAVRISTRARRLSLRVDPAQGGIVLVLPSPRHRAEGLRFARSRAAWILARLAAVPERVPFADGVTLPLLGRPHRIRHIPAGTAILSVADAEIRVGGPAHLLPRQVSSWLRVEARRLLVPRSTAAAARIGRTVSGVAVRDTRTRWGSCSAAGTLSYSWRLILAPEPVLDYVVFHEVAHLAEMNHGPRFWRLVAELMPEHVAARRWLKANGAALHRYG
ncbi:MAG: M48 family metallopeptidase [Alphaproteobacteria bacterium]